MPAAKVTVEYEDGKTDTVRLLPIGLVKAERHFKGQLPPVEGSLYAAWVQLKPGPSFDDWLGSLVSIREQNEDEVPLPEEPSPAE